MPPLFAPIDGLKAYVATRLSGWGHEDAVKNSRMVFSAGGFGGLGWGGGGNYWPHTFNNLTDPWPVRAGGRDGADLASFWANSTVQACLSWIQRTFPEARCRVVTGEGDEAKEEKGHDLTALLQHPNSAYSGDHLWHATLADWWVWGRGNAYWRKVRDATGTPIELWHLPAQEIEPWVDPKDPYAWITAYRRTVRGQTEDLDPRDVVHFRFGYDPHNQRKGWSPLLAGASECGVLNEGADYRLTLMVNHGLPSYALTPDNEEVAQGMDEAQTQQLEKMWRSKFTGAGRGSLFIPNFKATATRIGFSPQELDIRELLEWDADIVCALFGLSSMLLGLPAGDKHRTFANMAEAREAAMEANLIPTQASFAADLERQLLPDFEPGPRRRSRRHVAWDYSQVRVLQEDQDKLFGRLTAATGTPWMTANEARAKVDLQDLNGADELAQKAAPMPPGEGNAGALGGAAPAPTGGGAPSGFQPLTPADLAGKAWLALKAAGGSDQPQFITVHGHVIPLTESSGGGRAGAAAKPTPVLREGWREATSEDHTRLKVATSYTLHVNGDAEADLQGLAYPASGGDPKYLYSARYLAAQTAEKFLRVQALDRALPALTEKLRSEVHGGGKNQEEASVLLLQRAMAFRVGGEGKTTSRNRVTGETEERETFGAASLLKAHVTITEATGDSPARVDFNFLGKSGVQQIHRSTDPEIVGMLRERLKKEGKPGQTRLFNTNSGKVLDYLGTVDEGAGFKTHDLRTWNATATARDIIDSHDSPPKTREEFEAARNAVADVVAARLGDDRKTVLAHYIDPLLWGRWESQLPAEEPTKK